MDSRAIRNDDLNYNNTFLFYFERKYERLPFASHQLNWLLQNWHRSFYYSLVYLILVYTGRRFMRNRNKFHLYRSLIAWNILHSIFSILGSLKFDFRN